MPRTVNFLGQVRPWSPARLFDAGAKGAFYDPSDLATLWQDAGGTVPVTTDGQAVARLDDKSGNGHHLIGAATYRSADGLSWLDFDGTEYMQITVDLTGATGLSLAVGWRQEDATDNAFVVNFDGTGANSFRIRALAGDGGYEWVPRGASTAVTVTDTTAAEGEDRVIHAGAVMATGSATFRLNGTESTGSGTLSGAAFGSAPFAIAARTGGSVFAAGRLYGVVLLAAAPDAAEVARTELFLANKSGVTL